MILDGVRVFSFARFPEPERLATLAASGTDQIPRGKINHIDDRSFEVTPRLHDTFRFDPKKNEWRKVLTGDKDDGRSPYDHDARSVMYHDPVSGHGLLVQFQTNSVWAYDPDKAAWSKRVPEGDPMPTGNKRLAYFDPAAKVLVVIDGTLVWAYRYKA